jgi:flagellar biosynthetic protein FliR
VKISLAFLMTISLVGILHPSAPPAGTSLVLSVFLNLVFGTIIGFAAQAIFSALSAAGDMMNMQMGLSASTMLDPSTKSQSSVMGVFFTLFGTIIFMNMGGLFWLFNAFKRSFDVFGLYGTSIPLSHIISIDYLVLITSNILYVGLQIAAPVLLATLGQDIILGIISKTAPQVNVFQLSFLFKPVMGVGILLVILPMLVNVINDYFTYFANIY